MSRIPTIEALAPELNFPGFWSLKKLYFLKAILAICGKKNVSASMTYLSLVS